jgi:hypothetical protein
MSEDCIGSFADMSSFTDGLPDRFPVGTRYVIEGRGGRGGLRIYSRYLEFPDGRHVDLPADLAARTRTRARQNARTRARRRGRRATGRK